MPGSETPGTAADLRQRRPGKNEEEEAKEKVMRLNGNGSVDDKEKKTYGRTPDGTSQSTPFC